MACGGRVILSAQRKAGKTTCTANLLRSLADGVPFLGCYQVTPLPDDATVFAIDTEMSRRMLRQWYGDQRISHPERIHVEPLRGAVASFNLLDAGRRARWAQAIRERQAAVLVLDCIGPVLAAAGLDENSSLDVGRFLAALEELLADGGIGEAVVVHHMGHAAERSRGASRLRDWPDAEWKLVYEIADGDDDAGPLARRYFSAAGRDVAEPEQLLDYDAASRRLSIAGGTRRDEKKAAYLAAITAYIASHPEAECSKSRVEQAVEGRAADIRKTLAEAVAEAGPLCVHDGKRGARLHRIRADCAEHSATPSHPVQGVLGTEFTTPSRPIGRDGVLNSAPGTGTRARSAGRGQVMTATLDRSRIIVAVMTENDLERFVRYLTAQRHLPAFHVINSRRTVTLTGWPDWTIVGTRVIFRELKSQRGKVTASQQALGEAILAAGGDWAVWRPTDLKDGRIEAELDNITERAASNPRTCVSSTDARDGDRGHPEAAGDHR